MKRCSRLSKHPSRLTQHHHLPLSQHALCCAITVSTGWSMKERTLFFPGPHFFQSPGPTYHRHPNGDRAKEWMNERSRTNPCMGHGTLTEPEVGKLCGEELGRKPQKHRTESLGPQDLTWTIPSITMTPRLAKRSCGEEMPFSLDSPCP